MPNRLKETGKSILIVILLISAVFLAAKTELFNNLIYTVPALSAIGGLFGSQSSKTAGGENTPVLSTAALPVYAVVTRQNGDHCGIKYDSSALSAFYSRFGSIFGDAMQNSARPEEVSESTWKDALSSVGFYLDFDNPVPLSALLKSRDSKLTADFNSTSVRRICIAGSQNNVNVYIYFINEDGNTYYRALTKISFTLLSTYVSEYLPNDTKFAFELGDPYSNTDSYTILLKTTKAKSAKASNPLDSILPKEKVLEQFGINALLGSQYNESASSAGFVAEQFTLRVNSDGTAVYRVTGNASSSILKVKSLGSAPTDYEILEGARSLVSSTLGSSCGSNASILLHSFNYDSNKKSWTITFDYYVNGILVKMSSYQPAATINVSAGNIIYASIFYRNYVLTDSIENILPERQAAVLVSEKSEPYLFYGDDGSGTLKLSWTEK